MNQFKPIVPGCLALIVSAEEAPKLVGTTCEVIKRHDSRQWVIEPDRSLLPAHARNALSIGAYDYALLRIDGGEDLESRESKREVVA